MSFFVLITVASVLSWAIARLFQVRLDLRASMRWGMGCGFLFTGVDHFVSGATRYAPMLPDFLAPWALGLVYLTGAAELAGGLGLLIPASFYRRRGWPNLQRQAGIWLSVMLVCVVMANIHVAIEGQTVQGLAFGAWYYWLRPAFQPVFVLWALFCVGVVWPERRLAEVRL